MIRQQKSKKREGVVDHFLCFLTLNPEPLLLMSGTFLHVIIFMFGLMKARSWFKYKLSTDNL